MLDDSPCVLHGQQDSPEVQQLLDRLGVAALGGQVQGCGARTQRRQSLAGCQRRTAREGSERPDSVRLVCATAGALHHNPR